MTPDNDGDDMRYSFLALQSAHVDWGLFLLARGCYNANMPYSAKKIFSHPNRAVHVRDIGLADASDDEILEHASAEDAIVVTRDLDFANIILHPIHTHAGAVVMRVPPYFTAEETKKVLQQFLSVADTKTLSRALTVIEPGRFRMRR